MQIVMVYPEAVSLIQTEHAWIIDNLRSQVSHARCAHPRPRPRPRPRP